ncbi:MAG TPA: corrinoid protein [Candidatus Humimicrobiaceae bacterium]|jgi:corrinoid protein of di/trimethylamine methyltransferase
MAKYQELADAILTGDNVKSKKVTQDLVDKKIPAGEILSEGLIAGMDVVGRKFKANEMYIPEVLIAARAMHAAMDILKPLLAETGVKSKGIAIIGTVQGDLHDIGKNLVAMMLEGAGFSVVDVGVDIPAEKYVEAAKENKAQIVGLSALLTTTMPSMKEIIEALRKDPDTKDVKVIIGGAPVTQEYADSIGADGYAADASSAVDISEKLLN